MLPQYATSNLVEWQPTFDAHIGETLAYLYALEPDKSVDILGLVAHGLIDVSEGARHKRRETKSTEKTFNALPDTRRNRFRHSSPGCL